MTQAEKTFEELLAELDRRFATAGIPAEPVQMLKIAEAVAAVTAVGLTILSALRSLDQMFPEVGVLLRAEREELVRTAADPALVACWGPSELEPYGWIWGAPVDELGCALVPPGVHDELCQALPLCEAEQFDWQSVVRSARELDLHEAAGWIEDHPGDYLLGVYQGFDAGWNEAM